MIRKYYLSLYEFLPLIFQYTCQDLRTHVEIVKSTLESSILEANEKLCSNFVGAVRTALLETLHNYPDLSKPLLFIGELAKTITDTVIKSDTLMDTMESNVRPIFVAEIEKQEEDSMIIKQLKALYSSENDYKPTKNEKSSIKKEIKIH